MIRFVDICYCHESHEQMPLSFEDVGWEMLPNNTCYLVVDETSHWLEFLCGQSILYVNKQTDGEKYVRV